MRFRIFQNQIEGHQPDDVQSMHIYESNAIAI